MDHQALAAASLFEGMSEAEIESCAAAFTQVDALMGDRLTTEEDFGYSFFIVLSGRVKVSADGDELAELSAGDHFGEVALVTGARRNATVTAMERSSLAKIMTWDFKKLTDDFPVLAARLSAIADARQ
ncbi:MAG: cyclic nucleotide-binding domain-containing protein [Actinomycetota bacterium]